MGNKCQQKFLECLLAISIKIKIKHLVRDRYGKNLYILAQLKINLFANEIKAILSTKVDKKPNYNEFLDL